MNDTKEEVLTVLKALQEALGAKDLLEAAVIVLASDRRKVELNRLLEMVNAQQQD